MIPTSDAELRLLGVDPECVIASPRHQGWPIRVRHGDNLVVRTAEGTLSEAFGYFTPQQEAYRKMWAAEVERVAAELAR